MLDDIIEYLDFIMRPWHQPCHETMASTHPYAWLVRPGGQGAPLAGCRCLPLIGDDMSHDALMWGHGGKHVRKPEHFAWPVHFPWGQPPYRIGEASYMFYALESIFFMFC